MEPLFSVKYLFGEAKIAYNCLLLQEGYKFLDDRSLLSRMWKHTGMLEIPFQRHLSTYNYGEGDFFHDRPWQNLSCGDLRISNDGQDNQLPGDDLISLLCGIVSFCTDRELTRSTSPIVFHQSTIPRGLRVCVVKRKRWFNSCVSYYPKSDASFNIMELCIILSGNIHPLPVQDNETRKTIYRHKKINVVTRGHNKSN